MFFFFFFFFFFKKKKIYIYIYIYSFSFYSNSCLSCLMILRRQISKDQLQLNWELRRQLRIIKVRKENKSKEMLEKNLQPRLRFT